MGTLEKAGAGRAGSGKKKMEKAREGDLYKHCFKNLIPATFKKTTLQGCQMSKCRHLRCRVSRVCITTSQHILVFLQSLNMSYFSTKIFSNIKAYPSKCCTFCQNLRYFQEITVRANDGVVDTATGVRAKRISRNFTGSKKNI